MSNLMQSVKRMWARFVGQLNARAEREIAAWGSSLQYRRRYTNPDTAKTFRRPLEDMK